MTQQYPSPAEGGASERRRYVRLEQQHMLRHEKYIFGATGSGQRLPEGREMPPLGSSLREPLGLREEEGTTRNYSLGGALFEAKVKYNVGDTLKLAISIRGWARYKNEFYKDDQTSRREPVIILARVVRVQSTGLEGVHDIAVEFIGIDEGDRWTLLKHIKAQLEKKDKP